MRRPRVRALSAAATALAALAGATACGEPAPTPRGRFNLMVIALDTLRADRLGLYGYARDTSPNLDAFAADALRFTNAHSASPWTAPSLISLMTSLHPWAHGVWRFPNPGRLPDAVVTLAEVLRDAGFATAAFTEGGYAKGEFGLDQGFDVYPSNPGDDESHGSNQLHPSRIRGNVDRALDWIRTKRSERFFLFFQTYEIHAPYRAPPKFIRRFRPEFLPANERRELAEIVARWDAEVPLTPEDFSTLLVHHFHCQLTEAPAPARPGLWRAVRHRVEPFDGGVEGYPDDVVAAVRDLYDAEIAYTDEQVARLWRELERLDLLEETLIVVVADHGEGLGDHGLVGHGKILREEILRLALVIRIPGGGAPRGSVKSLVRSIDVMPTLLDALAVAPEGLALQGSSRLGRLDQDAGGGISFSQGLSMEEDEAHWSSARTDRWRYVLDGGRGRAWLFDRAADPSETADVSARFPEVAARLRAAIETREAADAAARAGGGEVGASEIDPSLRRELEALGYVD